MSYNSEETLSILMDNAIANKKIEIGKDRSLREAAYIEQQKQNIYSILYSRDDDIERQRNYKHEVTNAIVTEALVCLTTSCIDSIIMKEESNKALVRQLVSSFVLQEGSEKLLNDFKGKSNMLSELSYICKQNIESIVEKASKSDKSSLIIKEKDKKKFFKDLNTVSADKVIDAIRFRVMDSTREFIDTNAKDKMKIKDVLMSTKAKIEKGEKKPDSVKESYVADAKRAITDIRASKPKTIFESMVYAVSKSAFKNEAANFEFIKNSSLDMDKIVERCEIMYTFLNVLDGCKIVNIDEQYIKEMLKDLKG